MGKLEATLARLGSAELGAMLGEPTLRLLEILDLKTLSPTRLAELVVRQLGPVGILLHNDTRRKLIEALSQDDAQRFARLLGVDPLLDPWSSVKVLGFHRGQSRTDVLFTFFGHSAPVANDVSEPPASYIVSSKYPLFEHQRRAAVRVSEFLTRGNPRRVLLHMPTGAGKTRTAMHVISEQLRSFEADKLVVWLAHTEELCDQAADEFEKAWSALGNRDATIFHHYGPHRVDFDQVRGGFLVGGLQLLYQHSLTYQSAFLRVGRRTPLVVMDEAHQAVAATYNHLLNLLACHPETAILGLSATPGRSWLDPVEDLKLASLFARQKVTLEAEGYSSPVEYLQDQGYLARVVYVPLHYSPGEPFELTLKEREDLATGLDLPSNVIERLGKDYQRNLLILTRVMDEAKQGAKILVFACSIQHAYLLANLLRLKDFKAAAVTGETRPDVRRQLIAQYRDSDEIQILTNFGVLTMGFDAPRTSVAVIARPTRSVVLYSQMVGRAVRGPKAGGNEACRVLTVVDRIPGFRGIAEAFGHWEDIWETDETG